MSQLTLISALPVQPHRHLGKHRPLGGVFRYLLLTLAPHPAGSRHVRRGKHMHVLTHMLTYLFYNRFLRSERNCFYNQPSLTDLGCLIIYFLFQTKAVGNFQI